MMFLNSPEIIVVLRMIDKPRRRVETNFWKRRDKMYDVLSELECNGIDPYPQNGEEYF